MSNQPLNHIDLASQALGFDINQMVELLSHQIQASKVDPVIPRAVLANFFQNTGCVVREEQTLRIYEVAIRHFIHTLIKEAKHDALANSSDTDQQVIMITKKNVQQALAQHGKADSSTKYFTQDDGSVERW